MAANIVIKGGGGLARTGVPTPNRSKKGGGGLSLIPAVDKTEQSAENLRTAKYVLPKTPTQSRLYLTVPDLVAAFGYSIKLEFVSWELAYILDLQKLHSGEFL